MKPSFLGCAILCALSMQSAYASEPSVPLHWGVYIADVSSGTVRSVGAFNDWELSPDGRFVVGGRDFSTKKTSLYEVDVVSTSDSTTRMLERFPSGEENAAAFRWSSDSSCVRVGADRNNDGKNEFKVFTVGSASKAAPSKERKRSLSPLALRRLKTRYPRISEVAFSPDGRQVVAYLSRSRYDKPDFDGGLWTFAPDGSHLKRLTTNEPLAKQNFWDVEPHWLPDSKRVAFRRTDFEDENVE